MRIAIYNTLDGEITGFIDCSHSMVDLQAAEGQEFYLNCPMSATHIIDNKPTTIITEVMPKTAEELILVVRNQRDKMLGSCDWTQIVDVPLTPDKKVEWATYRQLLRDFPATCDIGCPIWPAPPI